MKTIFEYQLPYTVKSKVTKLQEDGSELTTTENVEKKVTVKIKEPSRLDQERAKAVYQKTWSDCVRNGILTRAVVDKQYRTSHGILTTDEQKQLEVVAARIKEIQTEYKVIEDKYKEGDTRSQDDVNSIVKLVEEFNVLQNDLNQLESVNESLYTNTAEAIANEKQLAHNIFFLTLVERDGKIEPFVPGDDLDEKLASYDAIVENDSNDESKECARLYSEILTRNSQYISWLVKGKITKDQLKDINDSLDKPKEVSSPEVESV